MKSFDLFETEAQRNEAVELFLQLQGHGSWRLLSKLFQININYLTELLISGVDEKGVLLHPDAIVEIRAKIQIYREVANKPEHYVKQFTNTVDLDEERIDPYLTENEMFPAPETVEEEGTEE